VLLEEVARVVRHARELGEPLAIAPQAIDVLYHRYQNVYGQRPARMTATSVDEGA
jgi:L-ribulose-5-phosphate 4-epimerase